MRRRGCSADGRPSSSSRAAWSTAAVTSAASASDSCALTWASQMRTSTVPNAWCGRTDHHSWVNSTIEPVRISRSTYSSHAAHEANASGTPQRGKDLVKVWVRAVCSPESRQST